MKDKCVMCGCETEYEFSTHIDLRYGYVEGAGQLCTNCYTQGSRRNLLVDHRTIMDTPNDMELGRKIREMFWEDQNITPPMHWEPISNRLDI